MVPINHILVAEDEASLRELIAISLTQDGHRISQAEDGTQALDLLAAHVFQLVITDIKMPGASGLDLLSYVQEHTPHTPVIIITGYGSVETAVEAIRLGAFDFQEKPLNLEHLRLTVQQALEKAALRYACDYYRHEQPYVYRLEKVLAESQAMKQVVEQVARVAPAETTVMLTGESGTGKSLIAGAIHANSPRRDRALVTVNCAALPETLLESELFGHEKGA
ncbi:MAG: sigma-54-dependent Fis family transcriptional regulator, partial [Deltaproteobacteria bacterium]|nr:sigma-54-dependent Fis family transcriptional regulator [Deltaproteobacteria bacterium]